MEGLHPAVGDEASPHDILPPCSNGLVEHFYRQVKAALKVYSHPECWTDALAFVLLRIRIALKRTSVAQLLSMSMDLHYDTRVDFSHNTQGMRAQTPAPILWDSGL